MHYSHLEDYIREFYQSIEITEPEQLDCADIAQKAGVKLYLSNFSFRYNNFIVIKRSTKQQEWQTFGHEIGHYLWHAGNQLKMLPMFRDYQEWKANLFAYHFCVPTFMLEDLKEVTANVIMDKFNVESGFALRRLEMYFQKSYLKKELITANVKESERCGNF